MLILYCNICGRELEEPGALLFSPPDKYGQTLKYHLCKKCYQKLSWLINSECAKELDEISEKCKDKAAKLPL